MPAPTSPFKKVFRTVYLQTERDGDRRNAIFVIRQGWKTNRPSGIVKSVKLPDLRTMRLWRAEIEKGHRWKDGPWDGKTVSHVPIGWMMGLDWLAEAAQHYGLTQTQAKHAMRLYTSLDKLDLSGVWVLVNEYTIQDEMSHVYDDQEFSVLTVIQDLDAVVALRPWTPAGQSSYLRMIQSAPISELSGIGFIPVKTNPHLGMLSPPLFLHSRVVYALSTGNEFLSQLTVHFGHLIGNPLFAKKPVARLLQGEVLERFKQDDFEGLSWQEIMAKGNQR